MSRAAGAHLPAAGTGRADWYWGRNQCHHRSRGPGNPGRSGRGMHRTAARPCRQACPARRRQDPTRPGPQRPNQARVHGTSRGRRPGTNPTKASNHIPGSSPLGRSSSHGSNGLKHSRGSRRPASNRPRITRTLAAHTPAPPPLEARHTADNPMAGRPAAGSRLMVPLTTGPSTTALPIPLRLMGHRLSGHHRMGQPRMGRHHTGPHPAVSRAM